MLNEKMKNSRQETFIEGLTLNCGCWSCLWMAKICKMLQGCKTLDMHTWEGGREEGRKGGREVAAALEK